MFYFTRQPRWLKKFYGDCLWEQPTGEKVAYLTFDDGPAPGVTEFTLDALKQYGAKGSFFCIGKNVEQHPELYEKILANGHTTGNHTWSHLDGWLSSNADYYANVQKAKSLMSSDLFRPPFGRITPRQVKYLKNQLGLKTIMWSITAGDFDNSISANRCFDNVMRNVFPGAIVLLHESERSSEKMRKLLPPLLQELTDEGYQLKALGG